MYSALLQNISQIFEGFYMPIIFRWYLYNNYYRLQTVFNHDEPSYGVTEIVNKSSGLSVTYLSIS